MVSRRAFFSWVAAIVVVGASLSLASARSGSTTTLTLEIQPLIAHAGDTLTIDTGGGLPTAPVGLYVCQIGFVPIFFRVAVGGFDPSGHWILEAEVPDDPALDDLDITFVSYGIAAANSKLGSSNNVTVHFAAD